MPVDPKTLPDAERLRAFGEALDAVKRRVEAELGAEDLAHVKRVDRASRALEVLGRVLIHTSWGPLSFTLGVASLFVHKQLQATEVGHTVLHGAYDALEGADRYRSKSFQWDIPIDEASWRTGHNVRHHGSTNIAGKPKAPRATASSVVFLSASFTD